MNSSIRRVAVAVAAATALTTLAAPAALASTPQPTVPVTAPKAGVQLDNLRWTPVRTMGGRAIMMLRIARDPGVEPGGLYFLWNPDTASNGGGFAVGDDITRPFTSNWESAVFRSDPTAQRIEVRYGDPSSPDAASVVASVTRS